MQDALFSVAGVKNVQVNIQAKTVTVSVDKSKKNVDALAKALKSVGYTALSK